MDNIQPGQMIGAYRIVSQIGQGGMATVYKAYHAAMDRYVAVKVLPRQFAESAEFIGRFQQEARTIANLEHPHILPVYDYGESGGITYFVMRFLDTGTLKERIKAGPMPLSEADRLFTQLAEALGYAHDRGVIHRDMKPSNVLVDARGGVFLTDFGIAKLMEGAAQFTATGAITGTPAYMSPEQAQGDKIDLRSDIYSLGIVLYEMITGRVPFEAETPLAVILKQLQAPLPPPSSVLPDISPEIERVLLKALSKDKEVRYSTCGEFLEAWKMAVSASDTVHAPRLEVSLEATMAAPPPALTVSKAKPDSNKEAASATKKRTRSVPVLPIIAGAVLVPIACILCAVIVPRVIKSPPDQTVTAQAHLATPLAQTAEATTPPLVGEATPTIEAASAGEPGWTSWVAGNTIFSVAVNGDKVYAGGLGGITVWSRSTGEIIQRFTTANGLPNPQVNTVFVDTDGTLWVETGFGAAHFDGQAWTVYTAGEGLDSDTVATFERVGDELFAGTQYSSDGGGLNVFDGQSWSRFPDFPSANPDEQPEKLSYFVNDILPTADGGGLWVATNNGLGFYDGQTWTRYSTADGLPGNTVITLMIDDQGVLDVGTDLGAAQFNGATFDPFPAGPPYGVYGIVQDNDNNVWLSGGGGIWRIESGTLKAKEFSQQTGDLPMYNLFGAAKDADGNLYFGSDGSGLVLYDGTEFTVWQVPNVPTQYAFGRVLPEPDGQLLFVEEYGTRVDRFNPFDETWSPLGDLPCEYCAPIAFDAEGKLWAGSDLGLWIIGQDNTTHLTTEHGLPADLVTSVAFAPDGHIWVGTEAGVAHLEGETVTAVFNTETAGFADNRIHAILAASDGSMWVALETGLSRMLPDGSWVHYTAGDPFQGEVTVNDIAEDLSGAIWLATRGEGVYRFVGGEWKQFMPTDPGVKLPHPEVNCVTVAPDGNVWFGTYYSGAARFDGSEWQAFDVASDAGLINWNVNDIYVDGSGTIWFATSGGVTRYVP